MRRLFVLVLVALFAAIPTAAQQPTYLIRSISSQVRSGQVVVEFMVINDGISVVTEQPVHLFDNDGELLASGTIPPLDMGENADISLSVAASQFPSGIIQTFYVVVGANELPPPAQRDQFGIGSIGVFIPPSSGETVTPEAETPGTGILPFNLDLSNPTNLALVAGIVGVVVVLLWVLTVIIRLLFTRPPTFPTWQPPYVITHLVDPNSTNGRRQLWQQHAQSDTLPAPCAPGTHMVRKLLIGSTGIKLSGWRVTGMRISQYDRYGRVARSETIVKKGTVKALNRAVRKSPSLDWEHAQRAVKGVARSLTNVLMKKTNKKSAVLPVALDIRFVGSHGEVRILFELYGCSDGAWSEIDHWEPEMRVVNGSIHENFTYTLTGQHPGETRRDFSQRLTHELTYLLAAMVQAPPTPPPAEDTMETEAVVEE